MKKKIDFAVLALCILIISVLTSCPASPPLAPTDGFNPYLAPKEPSTIEATNGYADTITLKWEEVEDATSYQVWATPVEQYGMVTKSTSENETYAKLIARGFELIDVVTDSSCKLRDLEANTAYVFSVVAMKNMSSSKGTTVLYSEPSAFVEGATFGEITLSAVANANTITLFWNISNLYSSLSNSREKEALYNYNAAVYKKLSSSSDWGESESLSNEQAKEHCYSLETSSLEMDTPYDFKLHLEILDSDGNVINTVESDTFTVTTDSAPIPSSVENIVATSGLTKNQVTLTWTAPSLADRDDISSIFKIQRAENASTEDSITESSIPNASLNWTEITSTITHNEDGTYSVTDTNLKDNTIYTYRIVNGYQIGEKTEVYQKEDNAGTIQNVYSLWMPENINFTFTPSEDKKAGKLQVTYTYNPPKTNPSGTIQCYIGGTYWTEKDLSAHTALEQQKVESSNPAYEVSIQEINPLTYYSFYFIFTLNETELVKVTAPEDFTLGESIASDLIKNFKASTDWIKAICLTWEETEAISKSSAEFVYEIYQDNVKLENVVITGTESAKSAYIECEDGTSHNYRIKVSSQDGSTFEVEEAKGSTLAIPEDLNATDGTSINEIAITWPQVTNENVIYTLKYSYDGNTWETLNSSVTTPEGSSTPVGSASLPAKTDGTDGNLVSFKLVVSNKEQLDSGLAGETEQTLESKIETGCVLGPALLNVRIENNGLDPDKITITWDKVDGADHYRIKRDDTLLPWKKNENTYEDSVSAIQALAGETPLNASYTYTVIPCLKDETQAVITDASTSARAKGKLFAPPVNINATKGASGITLTWDAVENATAYKIEKYVVELKNGKVVNQVKSGDAITVSGTTYTEKDSNLLKGNVLYKVCSVLKNEVTSQWQESYENVKNSLGFEEAANIGYKLQNISDLNVSSVKDEQTGYYADYTKITWYMVPGATSYTIRSYTGTNTKTLVGTSTVSVADLTYSETDTVDNGVSGKGFLSYDPTVGLYTYYDGNINFKDSYVITNYEIIANNGTVQSGTTNRNTEVYKQPNANDWVNIILSILSPAFKAANTSFGGDWWLYNGWAGGNKTATYKYPNTGMEFSLKTVGLEWEKGDYRSSNNYLSIARYTDTNTMLALETTSNIQFNVTDGGTVACGGTDPLNIIGAGGNGTIKASPTITGIKLFKITFNNVKVYSSGGSFSVAIDGVSYTVENSENLQRILGN